MVGPAYQKVKKPLSRQSKGRLRLGLGLMLAMLMLITGKLVFVQGFDVGNNAEAAQAQRTTVQTLPATRGQIVDINGKVMAQTVMRYNIVVDQANYAAAVDQVKRIGAKDINTLQTQWAQDLSRLLSIDTNTIQQSLEGTLRYKVIAKDVTPAVESQVAAVKVPGVSSEAVPKREYPMGQVGGNIVGFINQDGSGSGLEYTQSKLLQGTDGSRTFQRGADGILIPGAPSQLTPAKDGQTVRTTINSDLQYYAQQVISDQVRKQKAEWGNVIVVNAKTGDIVVMAEDSTVDPNDPGAASAAARQSRSVTDAIEPGSTEKALTSAALIQEGITTPSSRYVIPPTYTIDGQTFSDELSHGTINRTFAGIIGESLNTGTTMVGSKMTPQQRYDWLRKFGVGSKTGIPLTGESPGILATPDNWDDRTQFTVLFGQGVSQTPLQTAMIFQTLANNGVRMAPRLVDAYIDPDGTEHKTPGAQATNVVSPNTAQQVRDILEGVVTMNHYNDVEVPGYRIGGKTGTAETFSSDGKLTGITASFAGMAPMEDPQYVVLVTVQHPQGSVLGISEGPVFNQVMGQVLQTYSVPPSTTPAVRPPQSF